MKEDLFFDLIRVSLGTQDKLSRAPSESEWCELLMMAKKQSLVGVFFSAVQRLNCLSPLDTSNLSEYQYLYVLGMAAQIQQRNEVVKKQCVELQARLSADGFRSCVLKGQGVAQLYSEPLYGLRQSGDIDLWIDAPRCVVVSWAKKNGEKKEEGYIHVGCHLFDDTEVELHYRPTYSRCLWYNKRLQQYCEKHKNDWIMMNNIMTPSRDFNVIYILSHIYRHLFGVGIGLRQLMDYYFLLCSKVFTHSSGLPFGETANQEQEIKKTLSSLGLLNFAGAVMYVMQEVFHMDEKYMICPVDKRRGKALLQDVIQMGNFGQHDKNQIQARKTMVGSFLWKLKRDLVLIWFYPTEILSEPIWRVVRYISE